MGIGNHSSKSGSILLLLGFVCLLSACGRPSLPVEDLEVKFRTEAGDRGIALPDIRLKIVLTDSLPDNIAGRCAFLSSHQRKVLLNERYWKSMTPEAREALVFHELGHCLLNRAHELAVHQEQPVSLMNPVLIADRVYSANRTEYLAELFDLSKKDSIRLAHSPCTEDALIVTSGITLDLAHWGAATIEEPFASLLSAAHFWNLVR